MSGGTIQIADNGDEWPFVAFQNPRKKLRVLDLFSGIGGFSLGLERTGGFETVAFCEFDREAQNTLRARYPGTPIYDDVRELTGAQLRSDGIFPNAIFGGFPCQDVSYAGPGEGIAGARSGLWREFARLVDELRPLIVGVENVSALLGRGMGKVLGDLAAIGYDAEWHCIPASYAGARQLRDRVWVVAYPQCNGLQGGATVTAAWCSKSRAEQLAGLVQPCSWPTVSSSRDRGTGHGIPRGIHRNKQLGNAVVPQIPELIGNAILSALHLSPIPYRPEDEQDWRRSILSGIAYGPRYRASHQAASSVSPVPASIANAGDK